MKKWTVVASGLAGLLGVTLVGAVAVVGASFMETVGSSMEPGFRAGDLAVLHRPASYGIGDVAAYHSRDLNTVVMHRITAVDGDRYTFRGDNNSWLDPEQPNRDQLLGKLALRVPGGGMWLNRATSPAVIITVGFLVVASGGTQVAARRRRRRRQRCVRSTTSLRTVPPVFLGAAGVLAVLVAGAGWFAAVAWQAPVSPTVAEPAPQATMTYSYTADVGASAAYDSTSVRPPQPVFRNVVDGVEIRFTYETDAVLTDASLTVNAEISTTSGWRSKFLLQEPLLFSGKRHTGAVDLDLAAVQTRVDAAAKAIGEAPAAAVDVVVVAEVRTAEDAVFRSELPFSLDALALRLADGEDTPLTVTAGAGTPARDVSEPATVLGRSLPVLPTRRASIPALAVAMLAAGGLALLARRVRSAPETMSIRQRYRALLLEVEPIALPAGRPVIEVPLMRGLARLAERYGLMVMHWDRGGVHTYVVFEEHTTYRFRVSNTVSAVDQQRQDPVNTPPSPPGVRAVLPHL